MPLVLKVCGGTWENDSRDKRELSAYRDCGADVAVLAKGNRNDKGRIEIVDGFIVYRFSTRPLGRKVPDSINRLISLFTWAAFVKRIGPDIISGHDLMPGLTISWMSTIFNKKNPKLIYDSHEFEIGRNVQRSGLSAWVIKRLEKFLIRRCAYSIMVNDSIADEVQHIYGIKERPVVVRSTPNLWMIDYETCQIIRRRLLEELAIRRGTIMKGNNDQNKTSEPEPFLVMYHGTLTTGRGIEALIRLTSINKHVCGVILGNGDEKYIERLHNMAAELNVEKRILFHPAVPITELWKYVGAVDLSLMMIQGYAKSYFYSLPNKFFESIQALTPVVASFFPEMKRLIDQYEIGLTCDPEDLDAINSCVERMRTDTGFYMRCKHNLGKAKQDLCWEKEKQVLIDAFKSIEQAQ